MDEDIGVEINIGRDPFQISQYTLEKSVFKEICLKKARGYDHSKGEGAQNMTIR